jgi:predicted enzyme related to lactoylglutathione lyase
MADDTSSTSTTRGRYVWHELMTPNPDAAKDFYGKVVGWTTSKFDGSPIDYSMWMSDQTPVGGLMQLTKEQADMGAPPNWLAYVEVPNVDDTIAKAQELGGSVIVPANTVPDVGRFAILRDPQGVAFAVITSATPISDETDPKPREFSWHELVTTNADSAVGFYHDLFGWESKGDFDMGDMGKYLMYGRDRFTYGGVMNKPADVPASPYWLHYIAVADSADAAAERAQQAGATLVNGPMEVPGGDRIAVLSDPQGAMFAVHSKPAAAAQ